MKKARLILMASVLSIAAFSTMTLSSCSKDDKECPVGMEGKNCDVEMRTKFINNWSASDVGPGNKQYVYSCNIAKGLNINQVSIGHTFSNGYFDGPPNGTDYVINATVDGNTITIPEQKPNGTILSVSGSGTYNNNQITWDYIVVLTVTGEKQTYTGVWTAN